LIAAILRDCMKRKTLGNPRYRLWVYIITWSFFALFCGTEAGAAEKETLGAVEQIIVFPWNVKLLGRIDTGAATSSIDARDIRVKDNTVEFKLFEAGATQAVTLPIISWRNVRTSEGHARRPVVQLQLCIGSHLLSTAINLNDRSKMEYSLLIGRNVLAGRFVVDVGHRRILPPNCSKDNPR
jgi:hypothetical protein